MENPTQNDVDSLRRKIEELRDIQRSYTEDPEACFTELEEPLKDFALQFESKVEQILCDASVISFSSDQDFDDLLAHLKNELSSVEAENAKMEDAIEGLSRRYEKDHCKLEEEIERLSCRLNLIESQGLTEGTIPANLNCSTPGEEKDTLSNALAEYNFIHALAEYNFKILELGDQLEQSEKKLKILQDVENDFKRFEAIERIEDAFSGLKIVEIGINSIRLSLKTFIPDLENLLHNQKVDHVIELPEKNHEFLIELVEGSLELKHVEISPDDVYIGEIIDAAKSFRQAYFPEAVVENKSSFEWFVRRVQDRIVLCAIRQFLVKCANNARHSFEYVDREETVVAHLAGGVDAFIKLPNGWPLTSSGLILMSLKSSSLYSKEISLPLLCKVVELANSLDTNTRQTISVFVDRFEEILMQQMSAVTSK